MNFSNILFVGPQDEKGGIGAVLNTYKDSMPGFKMISTHPSGRKKNIYLFFVFQYLKLFKLLLTDDEIEILHIHTASKGSFVRKSLVLIIAKSFGKKTIMHIHGGMFREYAQSSSLKAFIVGSILRLSDCIICLTDEWKKYFQLYVRPNKLQVVLNPVKQFPIKPVSAHYETISLLFMGTITENKGIFELVQYLQGNSFYLKGKIKLFICGEGDADRLMSIIEQMQIPTHIIYCGWVDGKKKSELIYNSDILILPSHYEGLPIAILEAMSAGKPIIATSVGGIPSVVKPNHNGWLIDPANIIQLTPILNQLFKDSSVITRYGANASQDAKVFHASAIVEQLSSIYNDLLRRD